MNIGTMSQLSLHVTSQNLVVHALGQPDRLLFVRSLRVDYRLESYERTRINVVRGRGWRRGTDRLRGGRLRHSRPCRTELQDTTHIDDQSVCWEGRWSTHLDVVPVVLVHLLKQPLGERETGREPLCSRHVRSARPPSAQLHGRGKERDSPLGLVERGVGGNDGRHGPPHLRTAHPAHQYQLAVPPRVSSPQGPGIPR